MAIDYKVPSAVGEEYLDELQSVKPTVNRSQKDNDWWIRSRVVGGVTSGVYADQRLISNDALPQRAREEAVLRFLDLYFDSGYIQATQSQGRIVVSGDPGATVPQNMEFLYEPNGNTYQATETVVLPSATGGTVTGLVEAKSVGSGQSQNLLPFASLTISSPPVGIQSGATVASGGMSDARNQETVEEARARIVQRIREPLSVGRVSDYIQYAREADPSVVSASVVRYPFGLGTVAVYITSGTTDVDAAIDQGLPISVIPSDELVETVQAFLEENKPVTDCVTVLKPVEVEIDVEVQVQYSTGDNDTILSGQTLTQQELVQREVSRAIYKTPVGGRVIGASGYVVASDIEDTIDVKLSDGPIVLGELPILLDRQVLPLSLSGYNRGLLSNEVPIPGSITVTAM